VPASRVPEAGRSSATPPVRSRNGRQVSELSARVDVQGRRAVGGHRAPAAGSPSISSVCCFDVGHRRSREDTVWTDRSHIRRRRARVRRLVTACREIYGIPTAPRRPAARRADPHGPLAEHNDRNRDVAFLRLRERFAPAPGAHRELGAVRDAPRFGDRGGDPPGRDLKGQVGTDPEILRAIGEPLSLDWMREATSRAQSCRAFARCRCPAQDRACVLPVQLRLRDVPVRHACRSRRHPPWLLRRASFEALHDAMLELTRPARSWSST